MGKMRIGYVAGNLGQVGEGFKKTGEDIFEEVGRNTGNLAFWYASQLLFDHEVSLVGWYTKPEDLKDKVDLLFFPAANWLNERSDLQCLADLLKNFDLPCVIVGLGAQSESENVFPKLKEGTVAFLKEVSARTPHLFLRGKFSEKVCHHYGVKNTKVAGCPSILINNNRQLGKVIEDRFINAPKRIVVHTSVYKPALQAVERALIKYVMLHQGVYNIQDPLSAIKLVIGEELNSAESVYIERYRDYAAPDMSLNDFMRFLANHGSVYIDINSWIHSMRSFSHSLGLRIHGTILSLLSGTPAICLSHDTRTRELSETLFVPTITAQEFLNYDSIADTFASIEFNGKAFEDNRTQLAGMYRYLFKELEIQPSQHLAKY